MAGFSRGQGVPLHRGPPPTPIKCFRPID